MSLEKSLQDKKITFFVGKGGGWKNNFGCSISVKSCRKNGWQESFDCKHRSSAFTY